MQAGVQDSPAALQATERLFRAYWFPLYCYVRRQGYSSHDAQDLTQGFFARLLRANSLASVSREKGKFRTFLLAALNHFLSDERDRARAEKRGGGNVVISIDEHEAEEKYLHAGDLNSAPEKAFDRCWAVTVLEEALAKLQEEYVGSSKSAVFEHLRRYLSNEANPGEYDALAPKLGMSCNAIGVAVHRLRQRYRECIRLVLAPTVASTQDLDEEMNYLFSVLSL